MTSTARRQSSAQVAYRAADRYFIAGQSTGVNRQCTHEAGGGSCRKRCRQISTETYSVEVSNRPSFGLCLAAKYKPHATQWKRDRSPGTCSLDPLGSPGSSWTRRDETRYCTSTTESPTRTVPGVPIEAQTPTCA